MKAYLVTGVAIAMAGAAPAQAGEVFGGVYVHDVNTPLSLGGSPEGGLDVQLGYRADPIESLIKLQPYIFGALNTAGDTSYAAVGLSRKFGHRIYVRPGIGLAIHNGSAANRDNPFNNKIEFGSRILFEPEVAIGFQASERMSIEASWVHMSHAQLFGRQNPGIDNIGARLNFRL